MLPGHDTAGLLGHVIAGVIFRQLFDFNGSSGVAIATPPAPHPAAAVAHAPSPAPTAAAVAASPQVTPWQPAAHPSGAARRRDIVQCRSLRAIIHGYEAQFEAVHGRKPRGGDRGRLADTYTQYRALKQRIRGGCGAALSTEGGREGVLHVADHLVTAVAAAGASDARC